MAFESRELFDAIADFPQGMNSGVAPLRVPREQLAYLENGTVRGTFAGTRAAFKKITLDFGSDSTLQTNMETGLLQGCCYFKPDFGLESLLAQISGRLFQFRIAGRTATVFDQSIASDLNSATNATAWLWQSEQWAIVNDGENLPIFFDGNSSRRSSGVGQQINTLANQFTTPAIGSTVAATFGSAFTGPFNSNLSIVQGTTAYTFQALPQSTNGYGVTLKRLYDAQSASIPIGTSGVSKPNIPALIMISGTAGVTSQTTFTMAVDLTFSLPANTNLSINGKIVRFVSCSNNQLTIRGTSLTQTSLSFSIGMPVIDTTNSNPNSSIGLLVVAFTPPAAGGSGDAYFDTAYTGQINAAIFLNDGHYQITAIVPSTGSTSVTLLNKNAPPATVPTFSANDVILNGNNELPAGRMGAYGLGRNWLSLTDGRSFIAGDIVGGSSGLAAYNFRDAVLKITENGYLAGGGVFVVPGQVGEIRAMTFAANLDKSLAQGPLMVYTPLIAFSCNAPVDRTTWQDLTNPILSESMKGGGGQGQDSTILANSDIISRDANGIRSFIMGRRDFDTWGNVPISQEVRPILDADEKALLPFGSAVEFDNRMLMTANPTQSSFGPYHTKLIALNFDPVSSLRGKAPSVYDGVWTGLNVLKLVKGSFNGTDRAFAFCVSAALDKIELWEILPSEGPSAENEDDVSTQIVMDGQSGSILFGQTDPRKRDLLRLMDGEIFVDNIESEVSFKTYYKPDQWPNWVPWLSWTEPFDANTDPSFRPRMGLGEPSPLPVDNSANNRPLREAYTYQFRFVITGKCRFLGARFKAVSIPQTQFAVPDKNGVQTF